MKKFIKKNKLTVALTIIILVCLIICIVFAFKLLWGSTSSSKYGDRLEGLENYQFTESMENTVTEYFKKNEYVNTVTYDVEGKIIYITVDLTSSVKINSAKKLVNASLPKFEADILSNYDIQFIVTLSSDSASTIYPTMGYKSAQKDVITWINS